MQVLQAGPHKLLLLETDREFMSEKVARQAGFEFRYEEESRRVLLDLNAETPPKPPCCCSTPPIPPTSAGFRAASSMWMALAARCCETHPSSSPTSATAAAVRCPTTIRLQIQQGAAGESFRRSPTRRPSPSETVYSVLFNFLNALLNTGVGVCGAPGGAGARPGARNRRAIATKNGHAVQDSSNTPRRRPK